jgi:hypothetical protein
MLAMNRDDTGKTSMRTALGILIGLLLAAATLAGCGWLLAHKLHPPPRGFDPRSPDALSDYLFSAPTQALWLVAAAAGIAALIGAWPAARIAAGEQRGPAALWIGAPLTALVIAATALVPQPDWVPVLGMLLPIPLAVAAWRLAIPRAEV